MSFLLSHQTALLIHGATDFLFIAPVIGIVIAVIFMYNRTAAILSALALLGTQFTVWLLKDLFAVARPDTSLIELTSYAFPSGHAAMSFAIATVVAWLLQMYTHLISPHRLPIILFLYLIAFYIAYSRIVLGVHTWSQVAAGAFIGLLIPTILFSYEYLRKYFRLP